MSNVMEETARSLINFFNQNNENNIEEIGDVRFHETLFHDDECVYLSEEEEK